MLIKVLDSCLNFHCDGGHCKLAIATLSFLKPCVTCSTSCFQHAWRLHLPPNDFGEASVLSPLSEDTKPSFIQATCKPTTIILRLNGMIVPPASKWPCDCQNFRGAHGKYSACNMLRMPLSFALNSSLFAWDSNFGRPAIPENSASTKLRESLSGILLAPSLLNRRL